MKHAIALIALFLSINSQAADSFRCAVQQKVLRNQSCTICAESKAEECLRWETGTCLVPVLEATGLESSALHPGAEVFLSNQSAEASFFLSQTKSGLSAKLASAKYGISSSFSASRPLDLFQDSFSLSAQREQNKAVEGWVSELILACEPN